MPQPRHKMPDLVCPSCRRMFKRLEHFERHIRTHTKEKPFACVWCSQTFSRVDSLTRHHATVHQGPSLEGAGASIRARRRAIKACKPCAQSKLRCDGHEPCQRCYHQQTHCYYGSSKRTSADAVEDNVSSKYPTTSAIQSRPGLENQSMSFSENLQMPPPRTLMEYTSSVAVAQQDQTTDLHHPETIKESTLPREPANFNNTESCQALRDTDTAFTSFFTPRDWIDFDAWLNTSPGDNCLLGASLSEPGFTLLDAVQSAPMTEAIAHEPRYATSQFAAQTSSAVNENYQRIQVPETDQDAVGPRTYHPVPNEEHNGFMLPDMSHVPAEDVELEDFAHVERVPADITEKVLQIANEIQVNSNYPKFIQLKIPPPSVLNSWVQLYFEHFHPVFPILHKATFVPSRTNPFLVFVVAALGSHFSNINGSFPCLKGMHELIRRYTAYTCEKWSQKSRELWMTQTIILNQLGLMYSGDRKALELAELFQSVPVTLGRRKRLFSNVLPPDKLSSMLLPIDDEWQLWVLDEQRRRAGFAIWLIDLAYDHDFDLSQTIRPEELKNCLPQLESRWDAPNGQSWARFASGNAKYPTLGQVAASSSWRASWAHTGTLGKQAILQYLAYIVDARWQSAGIPGFSEDDRRAAARTLEELLSQTEDGCDIHSASELKAAIVHRIMAMTALMKFHAPVSNLLSVAFNVIYGKLQKGFWEQMADQWATFPNQGRIGVLFAARIIETVGSNRCTHFSTPVSLLRAVLLLWFYSTISDRLRRLFPARLPIPSVVLDLKALDSIELHNWIENGSSCVKLPGCGNIMTTNGRSKMLNESIVVMKSLKAWGINSMYAQLLTRLQKIDSPQE